MASLKIRDQTSGGWVEVGGGGAEEVAIGPSEPTEGQEIWIDTSPGSNVGVPAGVIVSFAATNAPAGWLLCNGAAVSRTVYADLFAAIGTAYGTGNGSSTFNLPNIAGQVLVNRDTTQTEFNGIGKTGGAKSHVNTHNHMTGFSNDGASFYAAASNRLPRTQVQGSVARGTVGLTHGIGSAREDSTYNEPITIPTLPPYFVVGAYIIKT